MHTNLHINNIIDSEELEDAIKNGFVNKRPHSSGELFIYNYTQSAQYEYIWNDATKNCRGLITDKMGNVLYKPFPKFFNLSEFKDNLPDNSFDVYEKVDGSLGVLYWHEGIPAIATRGSFDGIQAISATKMLHSLYGDYLTQFDKNATYLLEIIYPENRIVVNYGDRKELIGIAKLDTFTGKTLEWDVNGFNLVKKYENIKTIEDIESVIEEFKDGTLEEGFVIHYPHEELRLKVKSPDYLKLSYLIQRISNRSIWQCLKDGEDLEKIYSVLPDEYYNWVKNVSADLFSQFKEIEDICHKEFCVKSDRKETALYFKTCKYPFILFSMLNNYEYKDLIWKQIEPKYERFV